MVTEVITETDRLRRDLAAANARADALNESGGMLLQRAETAEREEAAAVAERDQLKARIAEMTHSGAGPCAAWRALQAANARADAATADSWNQGTRADEAEAERDQLKARVSELEAELEDTESEGGEIIDTLKARVEELKADSLMRKTTETELMLAERAQRHRADAAERALGNAVVFNEQSTAREIAANARIAELANVVAEKEVFQHERDGYYDDWQTAEARIAELEAGAVTAGNVTASYLERTLLAEARLADATDRLIEQVASGDSWRNGMAKAESRCHELSVRLADATALLKRYRRVFSGNTTELSSDVDAFLSGQPAVPAAAVHVYRCCNECFTAGFAACELGEPLSPKRKQEKRTEAEQAVLDAMGKVTEAALRDQLESGSGSLPHACKAELARRGLK